MQLTRRHRERSRFVLAVGYGVKQVEDDDWETAGRGQVTVAWPLGKYVDLTARAAYSNVSLATGNYSSWSGNLGLIFRLR